MFKPTTTTPVADTTTSPVDIITIDAVSPCNGDKSADLSIDNLIDNSIDNPIKSNHEIAIENLAETESLLNDAILQFEAAKLSVHNATTAPQPVVNMDEIDLESEAIRVAAIEAKLSLNCRTAELVLIARRTRVQNAIHAVKNAVEAVNEEVSKLLVDRMVECETHLTQNLLGLNEFRQVASALGWRSGTLAEACEFIERDYVLTLPDVALPRRVATPNCLAMADVVMAEPAAPKVSTAGRYESLAGNVSMPFFGDVQDLMVQGAQAAKNEQLIQDMVNRHDGRKFTTAPARRMDMRLGGFVNIELPTGGSVRAF